MLVQESSWVAFVVEIVVDSSYLPGHVVPVFVSLLLPLAAGARFAALPPFVVPMRVLPGGWLALSSMQGLLHTRRMDAC